MILFVFLIANTVYLYSQCPSQRNFIISSQTELEEFAKTFSSCVNLNASISLKSGLTISDQTDISVLNEITDLSVLNFLESIDGSLEISIDTEIISGFDNLKIITGDLRIVNNNKLIAINGFENLKIAKTIDIAYNPFLIEIDAFHNLETINDEITITFLDNLKTIRGFENLKSIKIDFNISDNPVLESIPNFTNLQYINDDFFIENNLLLKEIVGFENLIAVGGEFLIKNNPIQKIDGFQEILEIGRLSFDIDYFTIDNNPNLSNVTGFFKLNYVNGNVDVTNNTQLSNCNWLCNLIKRGKIDGNLKIQNNLGDCLNTSILLDICDIDFDNDGVPNINDIDDDNDGILDTLEGDALIDTDGDGFPDSRDLDSDGDLCFDVVEAGFIDENNDGFLGNNPVVVDFQGRVISTTSGYTTPSDTNNNSIFDFLEKSTLDPGRNTTFEICTSDSPINLLDILNGNPDDGGFWQPTLSSNSNIFDPRKDEPGIYTYTHTNALCGDRSAQIAIKIITSLSPGENAVVYSCETKDIYLFEKLGGKPDIGGSWSPQTIGGDGIFNPGVDPFGEYTYSVVSERCGTLSAKINVINSKIPNAGKGTTIVICEFSPPINLFAYLTDNPDTNGVWSPMLDAGFFDPDIHQQGTYTYTVNNGDCGIDTAQIEVVVLQDNELQDVFIKINDFSAINNHIEIFTPSNRVYEYSLDGINYQLSNKFNQLKGGYHKVL
ncbi:MAG: hypothetical protein HC798_01775 [Polaribacter sp.]|nr:hypothetical protein [Polaribacter sp.]